MAAVGTFASNDRAAQGKAIFRGIEIVKEIDRIKAKGLAALKALLKGGTRRRSKNASRPSLGGLDLARGFISHTLHDELGDTIGENQVVEFDS